jgi:hypothetical protein
MNELWEVLLKCKLAKKSGHLYRNDKQQIEEFIQTNGITDILVLDESNKQPVMRLGVARSDQSAVNQWKSTLRNVVKKFREDLTVYLEKEKKASVNKETSSRALLPTNKEPSPANKESSPANNKDSSLTPLQNATITGSPSYIESFLSKILASPDVMKNPSFFKVDKNKLESMFLQTCNETCKLERRKQKEKKQEAILAWWQYSW